MTDYKGFDLRKALTTGILVHAIDGKDAGPWNDAGFVGTMPDLASAKLFVDWLHEAGPSASPIEPLPGSPKEGHVVVVDGDRPDADAMPVNVLMDIYQTLLAGEPARDDLRRLFGDMIRATKHLDIAADQEGEAFAYRNFVVHANASGRTVLALADFQLPGEWNGSGQLATGIGRGWVPRVVDHLLAQPIAGYRDALTSFDGKDLAYARPVFVEGPEPLVDQDTRQRLKEVERILGNAMSYGYTDDYRRRCLIEVRDELESIIDHVLADTPADQSAPRI